MKLQQNFHFFQWAWTWNTQAKKDKKSKYKGKNRVKWLHEDAYKGKQVYKNYQFNYYYLFSRIYNGIFMQTLKISKACGHTIIERL